MNRFNLLAQFFRHGRTMGFVVSVDVTAEGFTLGIKYDHQLRVSEIFLQFADHTDHAFHCIGMHTFGVGQQRNGMEGTKQVRRPIDENDWLGHKR